MTISLRPEHEQFIQTQLASGCYANIDEVIAQAFQLLDTWQQDRDEWLEITRQKVAIGLQQIKRGEVIDGETVIAHLQDKINQGRSAQSSSTSERPPTEREAWRGRDRSGKLGVQCP